MISVCYSGNKRIFEGLLLSVMSLAKCTNEELNVCVLTMDLHEENPNFLPFTDEQISFLTKIVQEKNEKSKVTKIDVTDEYKSLLMHGKNHKNGYTPYAMLRLLLDRVENLPDKMIYLDIDTMCVNDIKQLYEMDVTNFDFGATKDYMGHFWIRPSYCNSGVLIMNLKRIKENGLFEKCRNMVVKKKMIMPDQSALNKYGKKLFLPYKFNEQRSIKPDTVVKHFCKGIVFFLPFGFHIYNIKQWQIDKVHSSLKIHDFDDIYERLGKIKIENKQLF